MESKRAGKMDASGIRKVFELGKKIKDPIDLSIGQPDFLVPENIKKAAYRAIGEDKNNYSLTQGIDELREGAAKKLRQKNRIKARKENVLITGAVSGGMCMALPAIIDHGDEVIIFDPSFPGYKQQILLFGGVPVAVEKKKDFSIDFEKLEKAITRKTRAIIFNTPENPTGHVAGRKEIDGLISVATKHDLIIISDEIYEDFVYGKKHLSVGATYGKTITLGGFSKSHAMTGWRVGYVCAPDELIEQMIKIQQYTFVCAPVPFQYAGCVALKTDMSVHIDAYRKKRNMTFEGLKDCYEIVRSDGAFYFFIRYPFDPEKFVQECLKQKLLIVPGNVFGSKNTHFRISFATSDKNIKKAIEILREITANKKG